MLDYSYDVFNGVIVDQPPAGLTVDGFRQEMNALLDGFRADGKQLVWMTLGIEQSALIKPLTDAGFIFHNCLESELTLILKLASHAYAPFVPTHTIGAGALVINDSHQVLVVRERLSGGVGYKLPGGHIELGEKIAEAVEREVLEETGIEADFQTLQGLTTRHPFRFGKSNIYFICQLKARTTTIAIQDTDEILDARWIDVEEYVNDPAHSPFNRQLVSALKDRDGLQRVELEHNTGPHAKLETFWF